MASDESEFKPLQTIPQPGPCLWRHDVQLDTMQKSTSNINVTDSILHFVGTFVCHD